MGVSLAADKEESPVPVLTFLDLNTMAMSLTHPCNKLAALREILQRVRVQNASTICNNYNH